MHRILQEYIREDYNQFLGGQEKLPGRGDLEVETSQTEKLLSVGNKCSRQNKRYVYTLRYESLAYSMKLQMVLCDLSLAYKVGKDKKRDWRQSRGQFMKGVVCQAKEYKAHTERNDTENGGWQGII